MGCLVNRHCTHGILAVEFAALEGGVVAFAAAGEEIDRRMGIELELELDMVTAVVVRPLWERLGKGRGRTLVES